MLLIVVVLLLPCDCAVFVSRVAKDATRDRANDSTNACTRASFVAVVANQTASDGTC
jgi:hypothetical protein